jgi:hypothetical protein
LQRQTSDLGGPLISKWVPGLPDGLFSSQKFQLGYILEGLAMEDICVFNSRLVNFPSNRYILWPFGIFSPFWYIFTRLPRKIWQPWWVRTEVRTYI